MNEVTLINGLIMIVVITVVCLPILIGCIGICCMLNKDNEKS